MPYKAYLLYQSPNYKIIVLDQKMSPNISNLGLLQLSGFCSDLFIHLDVTFNLHHSTKQQQSIKSFSPSIDVAFLMVSSA